MEIHERIKSLRKALGLTQQVFADKLGLKQNTVATYEMGRSVPSDRTILAISKTFGVSESWLRYGDGEMFTPLSRAEEVSAFVGRALTDESQSFQAQLLHVLSKLSDDQWTLLADIAEKLVEEQKKG